MRRSSTRIASANQETSRGSLTNGRVESLRCRCGRACAFSERRTVSGHNTALKVTSSLRVSRADGDAIPGPVANDPAVGNPHLPV